MLKFAKQFVADQLDKRERRITRNPLARYLRMGKVDCILDVGANLGQFAQEVRSNGYRGKIISFEPLPEAFKQLSASTESDPDWSACNFALGSERSQLSFNVNASRASSSFLDVDGRVDIGLVDLSVVEKIQVDVVPLDEVFDEMVGDARSIYLKIDTQGYESQVIAGACQSLRKVDFVQMECSLIPHYVGEPVFEKMIERMRDLNFEPWWIKDGYLNPKTFQLFQVDVFFRRRTD